jgi:hypothetical protein
MKKVLLIIIDGWTSRIFMPELESGRFPNFLALIQAGSVDPSCITIFPSITPPALASIATGRYPDGHGIVGMHWYDEDTNEVIYYGDDFGVVLSHGLEKFIREWLVKLNHQRLKTETVFQMVERSGMRAACLNHLIFRGDKQHKLKLPVPLNLLRIIPWISLPDKLLGPSILRLGDFVKDGPGGEAGLLQRYGYDDDHAMEMLSQLVESQSLPDLTVSYFANYDQSGHKVGPVEAIGELENLDTRLGELFDAFGGLDRMLEKVCVIMTADHSMSKVYTDDEEASIDLNGLLDDFGLAPAGKPWSEGEQLKACPNLRAVHIYLRSDSEQLQDSVAQRLLSDSRVDQALWSSYESGSITYHVTTRDHGVLSFWHGEDGPAGAMDRYGHKWSWEGELQALDGQVSDGDGVLSFADYPNAFERIAGALNFPDGGDLIVTALPGYEFRMTGTSVVHSGGGSHGSLHVQDSMVPLVLAGAPESIKIPTNPRIVDVVWLCLSVLGIKAYHFPGVSHADTNAPMAR